MKKIFLNCFVIPVKMGIQILLICTIFLLLFNFAFAQEEKPKSTDNEFSVLTLDAKTDKPEKLFVPDDTVKFKCRYLLPPVDDANTDIFFLKWQITGPAGKLSEGGEELSYFEKPAEVTFTKYKVSKKDKFGDYIINIDLYKGQKKIKSVSDTFKVDDTVFNINNVYTTDSLKSTKLKNAFILGEPIVFVVDHSINTSTKDTIKEIQFFTYNSEDKVVLELTSTNKFKTVSGHYASRFAKIIPKNLKPGAYTFMGKIVMGKKEITSKISFEIKSAAVNNNKTSDKKPDKKKPEDSGKEETL